MRSTHSSPAEALPGQARPSADAAQAVSAAQLDRLAERRVRAKLGWYLHALVFVCVNAGLWFLAASQGRMWALYPLLGWGLGLALHGASVWLVGPGSGWIQRRVAQERAQL